MSDFHETTAEDLKAIRSERELNQDDIAAILGIPRNAVSKIETGTRALSDSEKKLLDWYFFGTSPARIHASTIDLSRMLEFDEAEWLIIGHIARRRGLTEAEWIASRIRDYLAILDETPLSALPHPKGTALEKQA
jgi:transcriptional regulator with XRE-family HTH domain